MVEMTKMNIPVFTRRKKEMPNNAAKAQDQTYRGRRPTLSVRRCSKCCQEIAVIAS